MELKQVLTDIRTMKKKQEDLLPQNQDQKPMSYDFSTLKLDLATHHMMSCVQFLLGKDPELLRSYDFHSILSLRSRNRILKEDAKKIIERVMEALKKEENKDYYFHEYFPGNYDSQQNRVRALLKDPSTILISKQLEEHVISLYHHVFRLQLQEYLHLISEQELYVLAIPYLLQIIDVEETDLSKLDFLTNLIGLFHFNVPEPIQQVLYYWYQQNEYSFIEDAVNLSFACFESVSFVLNKQQKQVLIERFEQVFIKKFQENQTKFHTLSKYNSTFMDELSQLEKQIKILLHLKNSL